MARPENQKADFAEARPGLLAYVRHLVRDPETAEDLTQEALLRAHRSLAALKDQDRFLPWLFKIATNVCRDHFRKRMRSREEQRGREAISTGDLRDENAPRLDKVMECAEMGACVQRYFRELSDSYRAVILLHDAEGLTCQEIADMLDISLEAAKVRLHRARRQLRGILEDVCHFYTDERGVLVCEPKKDATGREAEKKFTKNERQEPGTRV